MILPLIRALPALTRWKVSLAVTFSAFVAMVMATGVVSAVQILPLAGIVLLASGASALNQVQERETDAMMERTKSRPLPSGLISLSAGRNVSRALIIAGTVILALLPDLTCTVLGVINILWYNGLYTPLKRFSAFAVVPGALTGAIPVYMGWSAMGAPLSSPVPALFAFFIFLWQMPHFWLLTLEYGEEYRRAGFPVMTDKLGLHPFRSVILGWVIASAASSFLMIHFGLVGHAPLRILLVVLNVAMAMLFFFRFYLRPPASYRSFFIGINLFMMAVMLVLLADTLLRQ